MKAPHLDQLVPLERGEADLLGRAIANLIAGANRTAPLPTVLALTLLPLHPLQRKLWLIHRRDESTPMRPGRPPKPRQLRVTFDQLAALLHHRASLWAGCATEQLQLQGIIGKFQQKSLNLSQYLTF